MIQLTHPADAEGSFSGVSFHHVERHFLIGMSLLQGGAHRVSLTARCHELHAQLLHMLQLSHVTHRGIRTLHRAELSIDRELECCFRVVAHLPSAGFEHRGFHRFSIFRWHGETPFIQGFFNRLEWGTRRDSQQFRQFVIYPRPSGIGIGVRCKQRHPSADELVDNPALRGVRGHAVHPAHQQRVVHDQHLRALLNGGISNGVGAIEGKDHGPYFF